MTRAFPIFVGLVGTVILIGLGVWQVNRLGEKQAMLTEIEGRIADRAVSLPAHPDAETDSYLPVTVTGTLAPGLRVLTSVRNRGAGYRMISVLTTDAGRRVMVDRGFLPAETPSDDEAAEGQLLTVTGNLHWPRETDGFTPDPDHETGLWFARDVPAMAAALETEPVLVVARKIEPMPFAATPQPVGTEGIPNDHLQYAVTWFALAAVWAGMTVLWLSRLRRRPA